MNDQQIYALMAKTPNIRAVQIADALDKDLSDVSEALRSLVDVGDVVRHAGLAPNKQPTQLYNLSDAFKASKDGRALLASVVAAPPVVPAVPPEPPPVATPVFATQTEMAPARTKAQIAIEHLTKHQRNVDPGKRPVNDTDMRTLLGLPRTSNPKVYLTASLKHGKIVRDANGHWHLGAGTPPPPAGQSPSLRNYPSKTPSGPVAQFAPTAQPDGVKPAQPEACKHDTPYRYECEECRDEANPPRTKGAAQDEPDPFGDQAAEPDPETSPPPIEEVKTMSQPEPKPDTSSSNPTFTGTITQPAAETVFRCGLWSDGVLELQRDGVQVVALSRGEHEQLADFMGRMLGHVDSQRDPGREAVAP